MRLTCVDSTLQTDPVSLQHEAPSPQTPDSVNTPDSEHTAKHPLDPLGGEGHDCRIGPHFPGDAQPARTPTRSEDWGSR